MLRAFASKVSGSFKAAAQVRRSRWFSNLGADIIGIDLGAHFHPTALLKMVRVRKWPPHSKCCQQTPALSHAASLLPQFLLFLLIVVDIPVASHHIWFVLQTVNASRDHQLLRGHYGGWRSAGH